MRPGQIERRTHDYKRHGVTDLFAALNLATGQVVHQTRQQPRAVEFRKFLDAIDQAEEHGVAGVDPTVGIGVVGSDLDRLEQEYSLFCRRIVGGMAFVRADEADASKVTQ